ncbi:MAG TPA: YoaK family protein [Acidimicrobiales bacterium]|nr:YoaK family protein [Acidimicrobiales bacterium]
MCLTLVTGATDAIGFLKLGNVFTSVMTGNMVLLGVDSATGNGIGVAHTGVAFIAYVVGTLLGAKIAGQVQRDGKLWPRSFTLALLVEFALFAIFGALFEVMDAAPTGNDTFVLLAINAVALGVQSAAVIRLGVTGLSTTYLTGTLTTVIHGLHRERPLQGSGRSLCVLAALVVGALLGALFANDVPRAVPLLPVGLLAIVIVGGYLLFWEHESGAPLLEDARPTATS